MSTAVAPIEAPAATDPRMAAFLAPDCAEVFYAVATPNAIWKADPYDVETIHAEARAAFEHLLNRAGRTPPPPSGAVLVLVGEAGSGKTHLMRAFRSRTHGQGLGYCGYLQMTSEASNYARYILNNLIDGLEQPYQPDGPSRTGLARLSAALLESVPGLSGTGHGRFRDGDGDPTRLSTNTLTGCKTAPRFRDSDIGASPDDVAFRTNGAEGPQSGADVAAVPGNAAPGPREDRQRSPAHRRSRLNGDVAAAREVNRRCPRRPISVPDRPIGRHG